MNFLSHYYFERYAVDSEQVLGSLLPDLLKNVDKGYSFQLHKLMDVLNVNRKAEVISEGWKRHVEVDRLFHGSDFFYKHTHQLRLVLEDCIADLPIRASFLAHISLELLLDHKLIAHELLNVGRLYEHLEQVDRKILSAYLLGLGDVDIKLFYNFYDKFVASRYIFDYGKVENLPYALFNICKRVWKFTPTAEHKEELANRLIEYDKEYLADFMDIYTYLHKNLE